MRSAACSMATVRWRCERARERAEAVARRSRFLVALLVREPVHARFERSQQDRRLRRECRAHEVGERRDIRPRRHDRGTGRSRRRAVRERTAGRRRSRRACRSECVQRRSGTADSIASRTRCAAFVEWNGPRQVASVDGVRTTATRGKRSSVSLRYAYCRPRLPAPVEARLQRVDQPQLADLGLERPTGTRCDRCSSPRAAAAAPCADRRSRSTSAPGPAGWSPCRRRAHGRRGRGTDRRRACGGGGR